MTGKPGAEHAASLKAVKDEFKMPTAAYQVSGEYSMLKAGIDAGYITGDSIYESLLSIKRAGADLIITYFAPDFLEGKI